MSTAATLKDISLALLLSLPLTFAVAVAYVLYPLASAIFSGLWGSRAGTGGVGAVAGGVRESLLLMLLVGEPLLFLVIFALLRRRRARR